MFTYLQYDKPMTRGLSSGRRLNTRWVLPKWVESRLLSVIYFLLSDEMALVGGISATVVRLTLLSVIYFLL